MKKGWWWEVLVKVIIGFGIHHMHVITASSSSGLTFVFVILCAPLKSVLWKSSSEGLGYHYVSLVFAPPAAAPPPPPNLGNEPISLLKNFPKPRKLSFKFVDVEAGGPSPCMGVAALDGIVLTVCPAGATRPDTEVAFGIFSRSTPSFAALKIADPNDEAPDRLGRFGTDIDVLMDEPNGPLVIPACTAPLLIWLNIGELATKVSL